jgi:hypothetical protein
MVADRFVDVEEVGPGGKRETHDFCLQKAFLALTL